MTDIDIQEKFAPDNLERCKEHTGSDCLIRKETDYTEYIMNGYSAGKLVTRSRYYCHICNRELKIKP